MSDSITRLSGRVLADYLNGGHRTWLPGDLAAIATVANLLSTLATQAQVSADAASSALALMQALGAAAYGVGSDPLRLPRMADLGSGAVRDWEVAGGSYTKLCNSAYQITAHDQGMLLLSTSGANSWTLPLSTDVPDGFWCLFHNISGSNLVIQRSGSGSDTLNGTVTTSVTIATATPIQQINKRNGATIFHVA